MMKVGETSAPLRFAAVLFLRFGWALIVPTLFVALAAWLGLSYGSWTTLAIALGILLHTACGMLGSYVLHECAHLAALRLCPGVTAISTEIRFLRVSLRPVGELSAREALFVAVAGPLGCAVLGTALSIVLPQVGLGWWYLAHLIFLAPCFGDGRSAVVALGRMGGRPNGASSAP